MVVIVVVVIVVAVMAVNGIGLAVGFVDLVQAVARVPVPQLVVARHGVVRASMGVPPVARLAVHGFARFVLDAAEVVRDGGAQPRHERLPLLLCCRAAA